MKSVHKNTFIYRLSAFVNYIYHSKNKHGVHSPFVYDFVSKCVNDKLYYSQYEEFIKYRQSLVSNFNFIFVQDFGAGSTVFKSSKRKISRIAKNAGISNKNAQLLFRIVQYFGSTSVLEIGSSLGLATISLALGNKNAAITTIEGCTETAKICSAQLQQHRVTNATVITAEFNEYLSKIANQAVFDLIYFDGNHTFDATIYYFEILITTCRPHSVWIFDDIHWSTDMERAWNYIKNHPKVTVTIDTFQWGIVFFRKEQGKENFIIRT